jgi:hypothetical protein
MGLSIVMTTRFDPWSFVGADEMDWLNVSLRECFLVGSM